MFGNFFRTPKNKKKVPVRATFRPMLESLEERAVPAALSFSGLSTGGLAYGSQAAGGQTSTTQAAQAMQAQYMQALAKASPTQLATIKNDMIAAGTAATQLIVAANTKNSTIDVGAQVTAYVTAVTDLFTQMNTLVQSSSNSTNSTSSTGTGYSLLPVGSSIFGSPSPTSQSSQSTPLQYGYSTVAQPSGAGLYVA